MTATRLMVLLAVLGAGPAALAADEFRSCTGERFGADAPRLAECTPRPNCVSSAAPDPARAMSPFETGADAAGARQRLREAIAAEPRSRVEVDAEGFMVATFRSQLFGFVDEAFFLIDPRGRIQFRSGACSGYYDFGVNRERMQRLGARLRP